MEVRTTISAISRRSAKLDLFGRCSVFLKPPTSLLKSSNFNARSCCLRKLPHRSYSSFGTARKDSIIFPSKSLRGLSPGGCLYYGIRRGIETITIKRVSAKTCSRPLSPLFREDAECTWMSFRTDVRMGFVVGRGILMCFSTSYDHDVLRPAEVDFELWGHRRGTIVCVESGMCHEASPLNVPMLLMFLCFG